MDDLLEVTLLLSSKVRSHPALFVLDPLQLFGKTEVMMAKVKKGKEIYLLVRTTLAAITNSETCNLSNSRSLFLPHIKSKVA